MLLTGQPLHAFDLDRGPGRRAHRPHRGRRRADDHARRRRAHLRRRGGAGLRPRRARRASPGSWAARSPRSPSRPRASCSRSATWNGVNILRTSRKLGLRSEASNRFEKQLHPELAMRGQRVASRLMVELCGARLVPGHDRRRRGAASSRAASPAARRRASTRCSGCGRRASSARPTSSASASGSSARATTSTAEVPPDRHYDVTREVDLVEEVGAHPRLRRAPACDAAAARRPGPGGSTPRAAAAPPVEDVMRDLGFDAVVT